MIEEFATKLFVEEFAIDLAARLNEYERRVQGLEAQIRHLLSKKGVRS